MRTGGTIEGKATPLALVFRRSPHARGGWSSAHLPSPMLSVGVLPIASLARHKSRGDRGSVVQQFLIVSIAAIAKISKQCRRGHFQRFPPCNFSDRGRPQASRRHRSGVASPFCDMSVGGAERGGGSRRDTLARSHRLDSR